MKRIKRQARQASLKTIRHCYRINRNAIALVKFIVEAYDNLAVMSTLDARQGVVSLSIAPGCQDQVDGIMASLAEDIPIVRIDRPPHNAAVCSREERICR